MRNAEEKRRRDTEEKASGEGRRENSKGEQERAQAVHSRSPIELIRPTTGQEGAEGELKDAAGGSP